jgi:hypothetical protein
MIRPAISLAWALAYSLILDGCRLWQRIRWGRVMDCGR